MTAERNNWRPRGDDLRALRALAIVLPVAFLLVVDAVRHNIWPDFWHSAPGVLLVYGTTGAAVTTFTVTIFSLLQRYEQHREEQSARIAALHELANAVTAQLDLDAAIVTGLDSVLRSTNADAGLVCRVFPEEWEHSALCARGLSPELESAIQRAKLADDPIAERAVRTGQPVVFRDLFDDPRVRAAATAEGIKDGITVPLVSGGAVNGVVAVAYRRPHEFTAEERAFLQSAGRQLGTAVQNAALYEQSVQQNRDLAALLAVSAAISSATDIDEIAQRALAEVLSVAHCDAAELWLAEDGELHLRRHEGADPSAFKQRARLAAGEGIPGAVLAQAEPSVTHALTGATMPERPAIPEAGFRTFVAVPIRYRSAVLGVLTIAAYSSAILHGTSELRLLEAIAEQLGPALDNARLRTQLQHEAVLEERERISREMHDGLGQILGYVNTQTLAVRKLVGDGELERAEVELERLQAAAREVYADVREGILALRTSPSVEGGVISALSEYVAHYRDMFDITVDFMVAPDVDRIRLSAAAEIQLIRIVQEALSNVRRHANATHVQARCWVEDECLRIEVLDNGVGFDPERLPTIGRPRFGLRTMRERAEAVDGSFDVVSSSGGGTRVNVGIPTELA